MAGNFNSGLSYLIATNGSNFVNFYQANSIIRSFRNALILLIDEFQSCFRANDGKKASASNEGEKEI